MNRRIASLDSLRGLAASTVVFGHCLLTIPAICGALNGPADSPWIRALVYSPLHILWAGHEAVILFFVLSGFVLALPYLDHREQAYPVFLVKRIARIYLPYVVVTLLGILLVVTVPRTTASLSSWFASNWAHPITQRTILDQVLMLGNTYADVNGPTWSLVHEMRISLVFPVIWFMVRKRRWYRAAAAAVLLSLTGLVLTVFIGNLSLTVYYAAFFVLGAIIARYRAAFAGCLNRVSAWLILAAALTLYASQWILPMGLSWFVVDWLTAAGASLLIVLSLSWPAASAVLSKPALVRLGTASYSLYLIHTLVLLSLVHLFSSPWLLIATPPVSIWLAGVLHRFVEEPSIRLGRQLTARAASGMATSAARAGSQQPQPRQMPMVSQEPAGR